MDNVVEMAVENTNATYTLRRLKDRDLWPVLDIIGKVFPDDLGPVFAQLASGEKSLKEIGGVAIIRLIASVCRNMKHVRKEVYDLLEDVSGIPAAEIEEMEFGTTPKMIWDIVANEKNNSFFTAVSKLS